MYTRVHVHTVTGYEKHGKCYSFPPQGRLSSPPPPCRRYGLFSNLGTEVKYASMSIISSSVISISISTCRWSG